MKIGDLDIDSRPREAAARYGVSSLSDASLLALLIAGGVPGHSALEIAHDLLTQAGDLSSVFTFSKAELLRFDGIGETKSTQLLALFECAKRVYQGSDNFPKSCDKKVIHDFFFDPRKEQEEAVLLLLSPSKKPYAMRLLYKGDLSSTSFREEDILSVVCASGAKRFLLLHNHPSGNVTPSIDDLKAAGRLDLISSRVGIVMEDFLIVGEGGCFSYKESIR